MGALNTTLPNLADQLKRLDPNGAIAQIVEMLTQYNPVLEDAVALEGNLETGHRFVSRTGLPTLAWRRLNEGVAPSKSSTRQIDEVCGLLEGYSQIDTEVARINGNQAAFLASENRSFVQKMANEASDSLFYASIKTDPEKIHGFIPRMGDTSAGENKDYIIKCTSGASGSDQTSMLFLTWGPDTAHLIYPKGTMGGLENEDLGKQVLADSNGKLNTYLINHWIWRLGLCIKDYRYHVRICNIDTASTGATSLTGTDLLTAMIAAYNRIQDFNSGRTVIYCNRTVLNILDNQLFNKSNMWLTMGSWNGKPNLMFRGLPIRLTDSLLNTESVVS